MHKRDAASTPLPGLEEGREEPLLLPLEVDPAGAESVSENASFAAAVPHMGKVDENDRPVAQNDTDYEECLACQ